MSTVALDVGTSQVKAVRFDDDWHQVDVAAEPTSVLHEPGGRREQDMVEVRSAAFRVIREVVAGSAEPVTSLAVTAQGDGCWLVDEAGAPVGRALLWNDNRAAGLVEGWQADGTMEEAFRVSGSLGAPGLANAQLRWLTEHEPDRLARAHRMLSCGSWVHAALTGSSLVEASDAANPFCAAADGGYDDGLLELFGLQYARDLLPEIVTLADGVRPLAADVAAKLGLPEGTPVALAPYDVVATGLGCGASSPGRAFAILGTTLCAGVCDDDPRLGRAPSGMTLPLGPSGPDGRWLLAYATLTGTEALDWLARTLGADDVRALVRSADPSGTAGRPLFLPYLSPAGERAPFLDPHVRGGFVGLSVDHGPEQLARSVLDGLTCAVVDCLQASGARPEVLTVCGGGARSDLWCQLLADAAAVPVQRPAVEEVGALGAALYGAVALGRYASLEEAPAPHDSRTFEPDAEGVERMADVLQRTVAAREALRVH